MTTRNTAEQRGDLAEEMLPVAVRLACLVRGDGGPQDIQSELAALDAQQKDALIVVLAGLVDPDRPIGSALSWLDFDENGEPIVPGWDDRTPLRQLAGDDEPDADAGDLIDEVAVQAYLAGRRVQVTPRERVEAIARGVRRGMGYPDFDRAHGLKPNTTAQFVSRERTKATKEGRAFPDMTPPGARPPITRDEVVAIREAAEAGKQFLELSLTYGLNRETISRIVHGETYAEYGGPIRGGGKRRAPGGFRLTGTLSQRGVAKAS